MKEVSNFKRGLSFNFGTVNAGQRNITVQPQVIVTSTEGSFRMTPAVSKYLQLEHGDYVAFANNIDDIDAGILNEAPVIVDFCNEAGLDIHSPEASIAIHNAFDTWAIYKGIREFDIKGNPKFVQERLTKSDRIKYVKANFKDMLAAALESGNENLVASLTVPGITEDAQVDILCPFVEAKELPKFTGSKCANPNNQSGVGTILTFTDSNVWSQLKMDLGANANKVNRIYDITFKSVEEGGSTTRISVKNGYETVEVPALVLLSYEDSAPQRVAPNKKSTKAATKVSE